MTAPAGPWTSTTPVLAFSSGFSPTFSYSYRPISWSSWVQGQSGGIVRTISCSSRKWDDKPAVSALRMWTSEGGFDGWGVTDYQKDDAYALTLHAGERFTSCTLWLNPAGIIGRIKLTTDKGQTLDTAPDDASLGTGISRPVGGGILCGAFGVLTDYLGFVSLGLLFLAPAVTKVSYSLTQFDTNLVDSSTGIVPVALETVHYTNVANWTFGGSKSRSTTNSLTSTSTTEYAVTASIEISAEFLGIGAKTSTGFTWTSSKTKTTERSITEATELNWSTNGTLATGQGVTCKALVFQRTANVGYTASVTLTFSNGTVNTFNERGTYQNVSYSAVEVSATPD